MKHLCSDFTSSFINSIFLRLLHILILLGNNLCSGDHVSWHCALDNSESRIQHMLMTTDLQLKKISTPFGYVDFVQIVGVCSDELRAAQQWNASGVLDMLSTLPLYVYLILMILILLVVFIKITDIK